MSTRNTAAVIGAGICGLGAIAVLKEEGFEKITCFEKTGYVGGLWRYHDDHTDGVASVMQNTVLNTSKEIGAFSNFPPPAEYPNYMHHSLVYEYIKSAFKYFGAEDCVKLFHEVQKVEKDDDYEVTGRWRVACKNIQTGNSTSEIFDCVLVCIGHHVYPNIPTFPNQEQFSGKIMHSHSLKNAEGFKNMTVVVVGVGNSGMDAAEELSSVTKQVYLSSRRGAWILPRVGPYGYPIDSILIRRFINFICRYLPYGLQCSLLESFVSYYFDHSLYNLKPKHRILSQHPTTSNSIPTKLLSGVVIARGNIKTFTNNGVVFENEETETPVDAVILCTGYKVKFQFLSEDILPVKDNRVKLYKHVFPPDLSQSTLAIVGLFQPYGPILPLAEMQCRWISRVFSGKIILPSKNKLHAEIKKVHDSNRKRFTDSPRHTFEVDFIEYADELAKEIGVKPNLLKMAITDPKLFWHILSGPSLPYQYRLQGEHTWNGARDAILTYSKRVRAPFRKKGQNVEQKKHNLLEAVRTVKILFLFSLILYLLITILNCNFLEGLFHFFDKLTEENEVKAEFF